MAAKDLLGKLADAGEEAIGKLAKAPGAELLMSMRDRVDELQRKVRGLDSLEARVVALEARVDSLQRAGRTQATSRTAVRKPATRSRTSAAKRTARKPPPPSSDATGGGSPG